MINRERIKELHLRGFTNPEIAEELNCHAGSVSRILIQLGLKSNYATRRCLNIKNATAKCSKCKIVKPLSEFNKSRKKGYLTYCKECKTKQCKKLLYSSEEKFLRQKFSNLRSRANKANILFNLTVEEYIEQFNKQKGLCFYTDKPLNFKGKEKFDSISCDKIIPENGYVKGNIVFCSNRINTVKNNLSLEEIKEYMPGFYKRIMEFFDEQSGN